MVDFRYHLVSIIAVFLALALGILVGTTALNGELLDNLKGSIDTLTTDKRTLEGTIGQLRQQAGSDEQLVDQIAATAVTDRLDGRRVVLVNAPGATAALGEALVPLLEAAGATVTATVQLRPDLLDPAKAPVLDELLAQVDPGGEAAGAAPVQRAATELAEALLVPSAGASRDSSGVLEEFVGRDLVDLDEELPQPADLSVLVAGDPVVSEDPEVPAARARALLSLATALDAAGDGAVLTGAEPSTEEGGALQALHQDGALSERVSSVDALDRPQGRLGVVFALVEQADGGAGRYGTGPGNEGPLPALPAS